MIRIRQIFAAIVLLTTSCSSEKSAEEPSFLFDLNEDGIDDVNYQYAEDIYYELADSNFDGVSDEISTYDYNDRLLYSKLDTDFDRYFETRVYYHHGNPCLTGVDTDQNKVFDVVFYLANGVIIKSVKYYFDVGSGPRIGSFDFKYGYPSNEQVSDTAMTEEAFSMQFFKVEEICRKAK